MTDSENEPVRLHAIYHALRAEILAVAQQQRVIPSAVPDLARRAACAFDIDKHGDLKSLTGESLTDILKRLEHSASFMFYPSSKVAA